MTLVVSRAFAAEASRELSTNEWVTEKQVSGLGLKLKPKARGVEIELAFSSLPQTL